MELNKRIERLEGLRRPSEPEAAPLSNSEEFVQKLYCMKAGWESEDKRRKALPLEEQIEVVKADREAARRESTPRSASGAIPRS